LEKLAKRNVRVGKRIGPCIEKVATATGDYPTIAPITFDQDVLDELKTTSLDMWKFTEEELMYLIPEMFDEFGLFEEFNLDRVVMINFLSTVKEMYNRNPFHNFSHCFCVTQMVMFE
jgi:high affinity cGMP-specific 3',5'-cyclic phosphodiesterase 9